LRWFASYGFDGLRSMCRESPRAALRSVFWSRCADYIGRPELETNEAAPSVGCGLGPEWLNRGAPAPRPQLREKEGVFPGRDCL